MTTTQSKGSAIKGILGVKLGMTQVFDENNKVIPVTVIEAGPCVVTQVRTLEKDGYEAVQMAFGAIDPRKVSKPEAGQFAKAGVTPRKYVGELRTSNASSYSVGQEVKADIFTPGEIVDAQGTSLGKGSAGVMKRHNFRGFGDGHARQGHGHESGQQSLRVEKLGSGIHDSRAPLQVVAQVKADDVAIKIVNDDVGFVLGVGIGWLKG
ncbi:MAG: hypothetical protein RLZZ19_473 [Actinomycetota bacterium]